MEQRTKEEVGPLEYLTVCANGDIGITSGLKAVFLEEVEVMRVLIVAAKRLLAAVLLCRMNRLAPHGLTLDDIVKQIDVPVHLILTLQTA